MDRGGLVGVVLVLGAVIILFMIVLLIASCAADIRKDGVCVGAGYDECVYEAEQFWCIRTNESGELVGVPYNTVLDMVSK